MKKTYLLLVGVAGALLSCKKDYNCQCTYTYTATNNATGQTISSTTGQVSSTTINDSKDNAENRCGELSTTITDTYVDSYTGQTITYTYGNNCSITD